MLFNYLENVIKKRFFTLNQLLFWTYCSILNDKLNFNSKINDLFAKKKKKKLRCNSYKITWFKLITTYSYKSTTIIIWWK